MLAAILHKIQQPIGLHQGSKPRFGKNVYKWAITYSC